MSALGLVILVFVLLCGGAAAGFFVSLRLPERHRAPESMDVVQLAVGLLATFAAIVLGLLTSSVSSGYETAYQTQGAFAGQLAQLDRCLRDYGPETQATRAKLRSYVAAVVVSTWPSEPAPAGVAIADTNMRRTGEDPVLTNVIDEIGIETRSLQPTDRLRQSVAAACMSQYDDMVKSRWVVIEGAHGSISTPFVWILVAWLVILFAGFGLRAPPNALNVIVIGLCAVSISTAVFVIVDLDQPYGGLFGVSSEAMRNALADMMR
jgi:hypothetical protein